MTMRNIVHSVQFSFSWVGYVVLSSALIVNVANDVVFIFISRTDLVFYPPIITQRGPDRHFLEISKLPRDEENWKLVLV